MSTPTPLSTLPPEIADARARLGAAYRRLGHAIAGHDAPLDVLEAATRQLDATAAAVAVEPRGNNGVLRPDREWSSPPADGEELSTFDERPVSGRSAPIGLDLRIVREGDEIVADFTFGKAHEGAPARSHGGFISMLFDDLFGFVLTLHQQPGFTGELGIRYEAPTPIAEPLQCRVRLTERQGRKLLMSGELVVVSTGVVTARATATFIVVDLDVFKLQSDQPA